MSEARIRVAVVDDHRLVAEGLGALLAAQDLEVVATASSWTELVNHPALPVDVAIIDLHLGDGMLVATRIRALTTMGTAAVIVSRHADARSVASAMTAGAGAFVAKGDTVDDLVIAIRTVASGGRHLADHHATALAQTQGIPDPRLGRQEERALVLYAGGESIREVAQHMDTTEETVKSYIKRGRRKFREIGIDIGTRVLLRRFAVREGWLNAEN